MKKEKSNILPFNKEHSKESSTEPTFEEKLSEIMQTIPGGQAPVLPDLTEIFGRVGGYEREVEDEEQYQLYLKIREDVSREAEQTYRRDSDNNSPVLGSCHAIWAIEKKIYRDRYGIDWHTPQEMHPEINFD